MIEIRHNAIQHKRTGSIESLHDGWDWSSTAKFKELHKFMSSTWSNPVNISTSHYGRDMESLVHTINEHSNQSFLVYQTERIEKGKLSQPCSDQVTSQKWVRDAKFFQPLGDTLLPKM